MLQQGYCVEISSLVCAEDNFQRHILVHPYRKDLPEQGAAYLTSRVIYIDFEQ